MRKKSVEVQKFDVFGNKILKDERSADSGRWLSAKVLWFWRFYQRLSISIKTHFKNETYTSCPNGIFFKESQQLDQFVVASLLIL
jgi:hypothetical protein